jgi:hypothetical protein
MKQYRILTVMLLAVGAVQSEAQIIFNTSSGATPVATGLYDSVYHNVPTGGTSPTSINGPIFVGSGPPTSGDISSVELYAAGTTPTYTFLNANTGFNYSGSGYPSTAGYLGADAAGNALTDAGGYGDTIFDALGYINVSLADVNQTYTFTLNQADDAGRVMIGGNGTPGSGTMIVEQNFVGGLSPSSQTVKFTTPGLYDVEVMTYQGGGGSDFTLTTSVTGAGSSVVYDVGPVPEPSTWALMLLGAAGFLRHRRSCGGRSPLKPSAFE